MRRYPSMSRRERAALFDAALDLGVGLGLAVAAGFASEVPHMTATQVAAMLDAVSKRPEVCAAVVQVAREQALAGVDPSPAHLSAAVAALVRKAGPDRGAAS